MSIRPTRLLCWLLVATLFAGPAFAQTVPVPTRDGTDLAFAGTPAAAWDPIHLGPMMRFVGARRDVQPAVGYSAIAQGYKQLITDLNDHFWDDDTTPNVAKLPRIRPTDGSGDANNGLVVNSSNDPSFWQMASYANVLYQHWRLTHDQPTAAKIAAQWTYIRSVFSDTVLTTGWPGVTANTMDDATWQANYLAQVHEVTGDPRALTDLLAFFPTVLSYFADPTSGTAVTSGNLTWSKYGILYAKPSTSQFATFRAVSSAYEPMLANVALYIYGQTGVAAYLAYAEAVFAIDQAYLKVTPANALAGVKPAAGIYWCELDIAPTLAGGAANPHYLQPVENNFGPAQQGFSATYIGGTVAQAVLAVRLYHITNNATYIAEVHSIVAAMQARGGFLTAQGLWLNDRDPWSDGYWWPAFAEEVLTLPGVDATGTWKAALSATALNVIAQRSPDGYYGGNWSGLPRGAAPPNVLGFTTYEQQAAAANGGAGGGQATGQQIMTSSNTASLVQAAAIVDAWARRK